MAAYFREQYLSNTGFCKSTSGIREMLGNYSDKQLFKSSSRWNICLHLFYKLYLQHEWETHICAIDTFFFVFAKQGSEILLPGDEQAAVKFINTAPCPVGVDSSIFSGIIPFASVSVFYSHLTALGDSSLLLKIVVDMAEILHHHLLCQQADCSHITYYYQLTT